MKPFFLAGIFLVGSAVFVKKDEGKLPFTCTVREGTPLPPGWARGGHIGGVIEGNVVVAGGTDWSHDKTTKYWLKNSAVYKNGKWKQGPDLPKPLAYAMYACDTTGLYIAGGTNDGLSGSPDVFVLRSLKEGSNWRVLPRLPKAISYGAGAILNSKLYISCGTIGTANTNRMWVLDLTIDEGKWNECQAVPGEPRILPSLVAFGEYLYLLGGLAEITPLTPLQDVYRYDPDENVWTRLDDLPFSGYGWVSQPVGKNCLLLTGRADGTIHREIWTIDIENGYVEEIGNLVIPSMTAPLVRAGDNQWWLIGGEPDADKNRTGKVSVISLTAKNRYELKTK